MFKSLTEHVDVPNQRGEFVARLHHDEVSPDALAVVPALGPRAREVQ